MEVMPLVLKILVVMAFAYLIIRLTCGFIDNFTRKGYLEAPYDSIFKAISKWLIVIIVILIALQMTGVPVSHVFATLSAVLVLVAVGFVAVWSVLSNILCSFLLLLFPPFAFGDEIELKEPDKEFGFRGKVINLNLFYTTLQACIDGVEGTQTFKIPNTMFFQRIITSHEKSNERDLKFGSINSDTADDSK